MLPTTVDRVPLNTDKYVNEQIRRRTKENIARFRSAGPAEIRQRLEELEAEWDIERTLEVNAATVTLIGLTLGATVDRRFFILPAVVACFLLQHGVQGWCPPIPILRRMGIRTSYEIDNERYALKALRGDFEMSPEDRTHMTAELALHASEM
jgi:hypothetical protein